jgi:hypothetical protein
MGTKKRKIKDVELCVACGARTNYSKDEPIGHRYGYVEGTGQFCFKCSYFGIKGQHQEVSS